MQKGVIVQLRSGFENVYPLSFPGAQAKVVDYTIDPEGFERIKIEWDKDYWRYNNEKDVWTYASHFEVIHPAEPMAPKIEEEEKQERQPSTEAEVESSVDEFANIMMQAFHDVKEGAGFIILTISPDDDGVLGPHLYSASLDDKINTVLQSQIIHVAANVLQAFRGR